MATCGSSKASELCRLCDCGNLKVCVITGVGYRYWLSGWGWKSNYRTNAYTVIKHWLRVSDVQFVEIINRTQTAFADPDGRTIEAIHKVMKRDGALCQCGHITSVFIGHSHGASCLHKAMQSVPGLPPRNVKYFDRMAVFSIGGFQIFERKAAKVAMNFYFENDVFVSNLKSLWWNEAETACNIIRLGPFVRRSKAEYDVVCQCCLTGQGAKAKPKTESQPSVNQPASVEPNASGRKPEANAAASREATRAAIEKGAMSLGNDENPLVVAHYLHDYICCKNLELEIKKSLGLNN